MNFYKKLTALRESKNLSPQQLADAVGVARSAIWKYEHNTAIPSAEILKRIAEYFRVTTDYLVFDDKKDDEIVKIEDKNFARLFAEVSKLDSKKKDAIRKVVEVMLDKN